jgi:hypothetical protein
MPAITKFWQLSLFIISISLTSVGPVSVDLNELLRQVPENANSLLLIDAKRLSLLPASARAKLDKEYAEAKDSAPLELPQGVQDIVMATEFDIQHMAPLQQIVALSLNEALDIDSVAKKRNGLIDQIGGVPVIWIQGACIFVNSDKQPTLVTPMNRQTAARWQRRISDNEAPQLSNYLRQIAESYRQGEAQIVFALDLQYVLSPPAIQKAVERNSLFVGADAAEITRVLSSLRGLSIACNMQTEQCFITIEFTEDASALKPFAEELIESGLSEIGARLDDPENWNVKMSGKHVVLEGKLSPSILQRVFSLNSLASLARDPDSSAAITPTKTEPKSIGQSSAAQREAQNDFDRARRRSRRYFQSISSKLDDLNKSGDTHSLTAATLWITNYARSIELLPTTDVDPALVEYGAFVARSLNEIVTVLFDAEQRVMGRESEVSPAAGTQVTMLPTRRINYGGYVYHQYAPMITQNLDLGAAIGQRDRIRNEEASTANQQARSIMAKINEQHDRVRNEMSKKYSEPF